MDNEIKRPNIKRPDFPNDIHYDYRNYECAGKYRGVGDPGKIGKQNPSSLDSMPSEAMSMQVPRERERQT